VPKRLDAPDTLEPVIGFLLRWAAEGWGVSDVECHVEYVAVKTGSRKLPREATVMVRLTPGRD